MKILNNSLKGYVGVLIRFFIFCVCMAYVFKGINLHTVLSEVHKFAWSSLVVVLTISFLGYLLLAERLQFLFDREVTFTDSFNACMLCLAINNILPAKMGEMAKIIFIRNLASVTLAYSFANVFWERFFDLNVLLVLAFITVCFFKLKLLILPVFLSVLSVWLFLLALYFWHHMVDRLIQLFPIMRLRKFLIESNMQVRKQMTVRFCFLLGFRSLAIQFTNAFYSVLALVWMAGLSLTIWQAAVVFLLSAFGAIIPSLPGGFGVFEAAVVFSLSLFGIEKEQALAIGFVLHMIQYIPTTVIGLLVIVSSKFKLESLRQESTSL